MIELATVADLLEVLAKPECSDALEHWVGVIGPQFGGDTWRNDGGVALTALLNSWAPQWQDTLIEAVQQGRDGSGAGLIAWLYAAEAEGRSGIENIGPWESMPGWWTGIDPATGEWMACESAESPTAKTVGWVTCASVLALQAAGPASGTSLQAASWFEGEPQPVPERDGWWAVRDVNGQWWAIQAPECPDAQTEGWIVYEEAFTAPAAADAATWVQAEPSEQAKGPGGDARHAGVFGGHRAPAPEPTQPPQASTSAAAGGMPQSSGESQLADAEEPLDDEELMEELIEHNKNVIDYTKNGVEVPLVIVKASGGLFDQQTKGYGCLLAPTAEVLHGRKSYFDGTVRVRRERLKWYLDFVGIPSEYRSACAYCLGYIQDYYMEFLDSSGANIDDSGAFLPYGAQFGGSIAERVQDKPDLANAAAVNRANLATLDPELQWQLGRNGLLLIGSRMNDEDARCGHTAYNIRVMAESVPGQVVGRGTISFRDDRRGRVTAVVFHSVKESDRDVLLREAKNAMPKMRFELVASD